MRAIKNLAIHGDPESLEQFIVETELTPPSGWRYLPEVERRPTSRMVDLSDLASEVDSFRFVWSGAENLSPNELVLRRIGRECLISDHSFPNSDLSNDEPGELVFRFYRDVVQPWEARYLLSATLLPEVSEWLDALPQETRRHLQAWRDEIKHRDDVLSLEEHLMFGLWDDFAIQAYRDEAPIRGGLEVCLHDWGFGESECVLLVERYDTVIGILNHYDEVRTQVPS
ncbi:hypothetical protein TA3x_005409 [Tundrisphaera sp. TA3]|uniref:hypothetical protein n=1 Tax=Tundrisphaera sp. TA3 TaxID=3435775 RepID=UPI003EC04384